MFEKGTFNVMNDSSNELKDEQVMPTEIGLSKLHTNEVFFAENSYVADGSNLSDKPYYMGGEKGLSIIENEVESEIYKDLGISANDEYTATKEILAFADSNSDDSKTEEVVSMNVEGMPWYQEIPNEEELRKRREMPELNKRETKSIIFSSLLAALLVAGIFIVGLLVFLVFCLYVWL